MSRRKKMAMNQTTKTVSPPASIPVDAPFRLPLRASVSEYVVALQVARKVAAPGSALALLVGGGL